jgi:hypothetical protein
MTTIEIERERFNQGVQSEWDTLETIRVDLVARLREANQEQDKILSSLGSIVAQGKSWKKQTSRLADLRAEVEALQLGLDYIQGHKQNLRRGNAWLR